MPDVFVSEPTKPATISTDKTVPTQVPKTEAQRMAVPGHSHNKLSAFRLYPEDVDFETRDDEEKIVLLLRAHPITNVKWILITLLMLLVPSLVAAFGILSSLPRGFDLVISLGWYLITMAYALENFLSWYFNVYIVTNLRVIDVDFYNLIDKKVSDADIDKIQDVSYTNFGVFRMFFDYGDVFIQTAAEVSEFDFFAVPDPERVTKIINELKVHEEQNV
jgi:hypothetical protein